MNSDKVQTHLRTAGGSCPRRVRSTVGRVRSGTLVRRTGSVRVNTDENESCPQVNRRTNNRSIRANESLRPVIYAIEIDDEISIRTTANAGRTYERLIDSVLVSLVASDRCPVREGDAHRR